MRLLDRTNSHGALWNDINYEYEICYNDIFGSDYSGSSHPLTCVNPVVYLLSATNAHASATEQEIYNTQVCFGDLSCKVANSCTEEEKCVVTLSDDTNAHLSACNVAGSYAKKICCLSSPQGPAGEIGSVYWTDMNDTLININ